MKKNDDAQTSLGYVLFKFSNSEHEESLQTGIAFSFFSDKGKQNLKDFESISKTIGPKHIFPGSGEASFGGSGSGFPDRKEDRGLFLSVLCLSRTLGKGPYRCSKPRPDTIFPCPRQETNHLLGVTTPPGAGRKRRMQPDASESARARGRKQVSHGKGMQPLPAKNAEFRPGQPGCPPHHSQARNHTAGLAR